MTAPPRTDRRIIFATLQGQPALVYEGGIPVTRFRVKVDRIRVDNVWGELVVETLLWAVTAYNELAFNLCESELGSAPQLYLPGTEVAESLHHKSYAASEIVATDMFVSLRNGPLKLVEPTAKK